MSAIDTDLRPGLGPDDQAPDTVERSMSRSTQLGVGAAALVIGALVWLPTGSVNWARWALFGAIAYFVILWVVARRIEGPRKGTDRFMTSLITGAFVLVVLPLLSVVWTVVTKGANRFDVEFFTETMRNVVGEGGGAQHAIIGTLLVTAAASVISIPLGIFTSIYLVEYGGGRLRSAITAMVDVMTGIPSIVAGLFAYAFFVLFQGNGARSGLAGAVALSVLMTPVVIRASEEMLRLVPNELREASYALGVPKWKTITKVVLPTAIAGILTGVTLAIARVIGETAPLLVTAGFTQDTNWNLFEGRMTTLPVFTFYSYATPTLPPEASLDRAWTGALTLILIVAILFTISRILARVLKPKGL